LVFPALLRYHIVVRSLSAPEGFRGALVSTRLGQKVTDLLALRTYCESVCLPNLDAWFLLLPNVVEVTFGRRCPAVELSKLFDK